MKNRVTVEHGMLEDLKEYLTRSGWILEPTKGEYEVLRARRRGRSTPLLVYDRSFKGCGYSIDEKDMPVYNGWKKNRLKRGLPANATAEEMANFWNGLNCNKEK